MLLPIQRQRVMRRTTVWVPHWGRVFLLWLRVEEYTGNTFSLRSKL